MAARLEDATKVRTRDNNHPLGSARAAAASILVAGAHYTDDFADDRSSRSDSPPTSHPHPEARSSIPATSGDRHNAPSRNYSLRGGAL